MSCLIIYTKMFASSDSEGGVGRVPRISSDLKFFVNATLICYCRSQIFYLDVRSPHTLLDIYCRLFLMQKHLIE
jgi:hypothetical protein